MGKMDYARRLVDLSKEAGADAIKFQLFCGDEYTKAGNIEMNLLQFEEIYKYAKSVGQPIAASVFYKDAYEKVLDLPDMHHIKFAYSKRHSPLIYSGLNIGRKIVVTTNIHDSFDLPVDKNLIKLMTQPRCKQADEYAIVNKMNFEGAFPDRFQGFSDHSLGYSESQRAVESGARWIEKHITPGFSDCIEVPDGRFALVPEEAREFVEKLRQVDIRELEQGQAGWLKHLLNRSMG